MVKWVLIALLMAQPVAAEVVQGRARVIDGDTLAIGAVRVRLHGIDAPEKDQTCQDPAGRDWRCGAAATAALERMTARGDTRCEGEDYDRYDRLIAVCRAGGRNLNAALVAEGYAEAYRKYAQDYVGEEQAARAAQKGIWSGAHLNPEAARRQARKGAAQQPPGACLIKGNISRSGRIFHTTASRDYAATRIDPSKGERWFCTEAEALAAGWRPVHR
ncbi:endonuclease YncB(thermonuclease family) [Rhodobacter aestuarii]|uniref:Endonuclease YncB, thermonuclease family n=1 Tax=Rhodobacter aestuarii TaxID=453582 RepID=A0A1N7J2N0_9RHOB|nr:MULTISPECIES: thermonuclease family protein [Rhodobacter]PTV97250.1 endonuclease YncB(thermonuclease family) [Rhodobacter aestuarii]SIS43618.1 Endonuclease YncB, thermonuclease family [Rhodobacter aestuarii]SOB99379.1 endonuclease YncB(thermonuclease family) [Rhodobacter sp. JA431]